MNKNENSCIQMDMEKIIIRCSAEYLQYTFPKRKWYQIKKYNRIALMRLAFAGNDRLEADILLEIYEEFNRDELLPEKESSYFVYTARSREELLCLIDSSFESEICETMLRQYEKEYQDAEHLIVLDDEKEVMPQLVFFLAQSRNYLSVLTKDLQKYARVAEQVEEDTGLVAMFFSEENNLMKYLKQMPEKKSILLLVGQSEGKSLRVEGRKGNLLYRLPPKSFLADFSSNENSYHLVSKKRMQITYVSIPIFLDNIVKNRYNAVVNEGITFRVMNYKKTDWRKKGNEDGRKEKYPDIRRSETI